QIKRALALIRKPPRELSKDYKLRRDEISQALKDISLYAKARMIRDLHGRRDSTKLNLSEMDGLERMKDNLFIQWIIVVDGDRKILEKKLNKELNTSISEIKLENRNNGYHGKPYKNAEI
ncbi:hypothetical protein ACFLYP_04095, partial [Chloroflexota bacterium]